MFSVFDPGTAYSLSVRPFVFCSCLILFSVDGSSSTFSLAEETLSSRCCSSSVQYGLQFLLAPLGMVSFAAFRTAALKAFTFYVLFLCLNVFCVHV